MKRLTLAEMQSLSVEMLKDIHEFCEKNSIRYFAFYGTLLGAVRHKGFIPWDDDVDIVMPREDYERFRRTYKSDKFEFLCREDNPELYIAFGRVTERKRTVFRMTEPWHSDKLETGLFIDVFPLDRVPDDLEEYHLLYDTMRYLRKLSLKSRLYRAVPSPEMKFSDRFRVWKRRRFHPRKSKVDPAEIVNYMQCVLRNSVRAEYGHAAQMACPVFREARYLWSDFDKLIKVPFEDIEIMIPAEYDKILTAIYGDYMTPPPPEKRIPYLDQFGALVWREG